MHDLPDFDTVVEYVKTGLKRKTSLDQIRGVLSNNDIAMTTINKAVVIAIEQLDLERKTEEKPKVEELPIAPVEKPVDDKQGYKLAAIVIFVCIVVGTILVAPVITTKTNAQTNAKTTIDSVGRLGLAIRGMFLNQDYYNCCKASLTELSVKEQFDVCSVGSNYYDDYEVFRASQNKDSVAKIIDVVQQKCSMLPDNLGSICSEKTPGIFDNCYMQKSKSNNYLLNGAAKQ